VIILRFYNVHEATDILNKYYINNCVQTVVRWLREGRIKGERTDYKKEGWKIEENNLFDFIEEVRPGLIEIMRIYEEVRTEQELYEKHDCESLYHREKPDRNSAGMVDTLCEYTELLENMVEQLRDELSGLKEMTTTLESRVKKIEETNDQIELNYGINVEDKRERTVKLQKNMNQNQFNDYVFSEGLYKELGEEVTNKEELSSHPFIKEIYTTIFIDNKIKPELIKDDTYLCPFTNETPVYFKSWVKNMILHLQKPKEAVTIP
jgi:hypothetical protein